nr:MAG TPA: hypothetical protein [Caudoviricetes sp.]
MRNYRKDMLTLRNIRIIIKLYQRYKTDYSTKNDNRIGYFVTVVQRK